MNLAELAGDVVGQCRHSELHLIRTGALILEVTGVEARVSQRRTQICRPQRHRVGATVVVVVFIVERPRLSCHRCLIIVVDVGRTVVVVASPFLNEVVGTIKPYLLFGRAVAVGEPGACFADAVAGVHLAVGILVAAFLFVIDIHQPYFLVAALGIDTSALGVGIAAVKVAEKRLECHVV